jgi:hypothetical protein
MQSIISLDDVIDSANKYGDDGVLQPNLKRVRDLKTINPKSPYDTTYIPLDFKHVNGDIPKFKIKLGEQLLASSAKAPQGSDSEGIPKHLSLSFMALKREEIEGGDYSPKEKASSELQKKENARMKANIDRYYENNIKFLKVLNIIDLSYKKVCGDLEKQSKTLKFKLKKDRNQKNITIFSIKQASRIDKENNGEDIVLENPIYRLKIPVYKKNGKIGIWSNYYNVFKNIVFDARKMNKKNGYKPVPAKVKVSGKLRDLDVTNASSFITFKSLIGGHIQFECIVSSKFGLSLNNGFYDLFVYRHKTKSVQSTMSAEDIIQMRGGADSEEESDSDVELVDDDGDDDDEKKSDNEDNENSDDGEPNDSDEENSDAGDN